MVEKIQMVQMVHVKLLINRLIHSIFHRCNGLINLCLISDGLIFWSARNDKLVATEEPTDYFAEKLRPADVEMTGYALMSYLKRKEQPKDIMKIVKWLSKQRNYYGGFSSTQVCYKLNYRLEQRTSTQ